MAAPRPIMWLSPSRRSQRSEVDGSYLFNFYQTPIRDRSHQGGSYTLHTTPGYKPWAQVQPQTFMRGGAPVNPESGIFGLVEIDSPVYGRRLLGVASEYQFFQIISGGPESYDLPAGYDPFSGQALHNVNAARITNYTDVLSKRATGPIRLVTDGRRVVFVTANDVFMFDCDVNSFITIQAPIPTDQSATLPDEEWVDCSWIDGYFIVAARSGEMFHSRLNSSVFDQIDFATAGAKPDPIVGLQSFSRRLYIFGTKSVEQWYNAGAQQFAFRRDNTYVAEIGAASRDSIQANEAGIFFLASDGIVYGMAGSSFNRFSNETVEKDIADSDMDAARAYTYTEEGHRFYALTLLIGSTRKCWTLDTSTGFWHVRGETDVLCQAEFLGIDMVGRSGDQNIQNLKRRWGDENGATMDREAIVPSMWAVSKRVNIREYSLEATFRGEAAVDSDMFTLGYSLDARNRWTDRNISATDLSEGRLRWTNVTEFEDQINLRLKTSINKRFDISNALTRIEHSPD